MRGVSPTKRWNARVNALTLSKPTLNAMVSVLWSPSARRAIAFNNRLLLGGFAGEAPDSVGGLNPNADPAQENLTLLLLDAHRMLGAQAAELLKIPAFVKLFEDAFPAESAQARAAMASQVLASDAACKQQLGDDVILEPGCAVGQLHVPAPPAPGLAGKRAFDAEDCGAGCHGVDLTHRCGSEKATLPTFDR